MIPIRLNVNKTLDTEVSFESVLEKIIEMRFKDKWQYITWIIDDVINEDLDDLTGSEKQALSQYLINKVNLISGWHTLSPKTIETIHTLIDGGLLNCEFQSEVDELEGTQKEFEAAYGKPKYKENTNEK